MRLTFILLREEEGLDFAIEIAMDTQEWITNILEWLRFCGLCGMKRGKIDLYCQDCWKKFLQIKQFKRQQRGPYYLDHYSLFDWTQKNDLYIRNLVYLLKGGRLPGANQKIAWWISEGLKESIYCPKKILFVPAPPKVLDEKDHAYELALALSKIWKATLWSPLERVDGGAQKTKDKEARKRVNIRLKKNSKVTRELKKYTEYHILFVDDILTTGSTARAAQKALKKITKLSVVTTVYRPSRQRVIDKDDSRLTRSKLLC